MEKISEELKNFICANILDAQVKIDEDDILKDIGVDSFSIIEIVLFIERKFGVLIPDELLLPETFTSIRSIAEVVKKIKQK